MEVQLVYNVKWTFQRKKKSHLLHRTECKIKLDEKVLSSGVAKCCPTDDFNLAIGRKISLTKALKNFEVDRHTRRVIWEAFFKSPNNNL